jgi:hypothetical protein
VRGAVAFAAGGLAVLTVHQAALWALHRAGWAPWPAYSWAPTRPLGVPAVASAVVWGGVWWAGLDRLVPRDRGARAALRRAALLGAVLPNAAGALLAAAGRGPAADTLGAAPRGRSLAAAVAVNALWGAAAAALAGAATRAAARRGRSAA